MGFASYLEDIRESLTSLESEVELAVRSGSAAHLASLRERIAVLLQKARTAISDLERDEDLATDPRVDLARELELAREELRRAEARLERLAKEKAEIQEELDKHRDILRRLRAR